MRPWHKALVLAESRFVNRLEDPIKLRIDPVSISRTAIASVP